MQNFSGMVFATVYAVAAVFCVFFALEERKRKARPVYVTLLIVLGIVLWLFGMQHASGILSGVTQLGRDIAREDHWYARRRELQKTVVGTIPAVGVVTLGVLLAIARREWRRYGLVVLALIYLACFGAIRTVSLHQVDALMRKRVIGVQVSAWGDVVGLVLTGIALFWLAKTVRHPTRQAGKQ